MMAGLHVSMHDEWTCNILVDMSQSISWLVGIYCNVPATRIMKIVDYGKHFFLLAVNIYLRAGLQGNHNYLGG